MLLKSWWCIGFLILGMQVAVLGQPPEEMGTFSIRKHRCIASQEKARIDANRAEELVEVLGAIGGLIYAEGDSILAVAAETTILFYQGDSLAGYAISDTLGNYSANLPLGNYRIETCKRRFLSHTDSITITEFLPKRLKHDLYIVPVLEPKPVDTLAVASPSLDLIPGTSPIVTPVVDRPTTTPLAKGSLVGKITLLESDFPLNNVRVSIYLDDVFVRSTACDAEGNYRFRTLEDGAYKIIVTTNRSYNEPISDIAVRRGKIKFLDITYSKRGKIKRG